jgi:hypothetical protein
MPRPTAATAFVLSGLLLAAGCTRPPPEPVIVRGHILDARNKPVTGVIVRFWPSDLRSSSVGGDPATGGDGSFEIHCPPGKYHITLMAIPAQRGADPAAGPSTPQGKVTAAKTKTNVPGQYLDAATTPWRDIVIGAGGLGGLDLKIAE